MKWTDFVKNYQRDNHVSWKDALKQCGPEWKKQKEKQKYHPKLKSKKDVKPIHHNHKACIFRKKISKAMTKRLKESCGIQKLRSLTPKKRTRTSLSSKRQRTKLHKQTWENQSPRKIADLHI